MSEDELSPSRGEQTHRHQHSPTQGALNVSGSDANSSIIGKVKSRVSSIFPQTLTKWFSPSIDGDVNRNGSLRRRRDESDDKNQNSDDSDSGVEEKTPILSAPPAKRTRLNITEGIGLTSFQENQNLRSSTPLTAARHRESLATDLLYKSIVRSRANYDHKPNALFSIDNKNNSAVRHEDVDLGTFGSRRSLNIPSTSSGFPSDFRLRVNSKQSVEAVEYKEDEGKNEHIDEERVLASRLGMRPNENCIAEEEDEEILEEEEDDILGAEISKAIKNRKRKYANGVAIVSVDTASESGDSRSSSVNARTKSGLYRPSAGNVRSSMSNGLNFNSHLEGKKSLFGIKNMSNIINNSTLSLTSLNRKQFNASIYGSTSALSDSRLLNTFSPFYKGPTTFGGASAYSKYNRNLQQHSMRITPTLIRPTSSLSTLTSSNNSINQINNQSNATGISSTAKRILELINDFPTPLSDAKKMANNIKLPSLANSRKRYSDADMSSSRVMRLSTVRTPYSRPSLNESVSHDNSKTLAPPIRELQVPSMSQLLQMKKLQSSTERSRQIASNSKSVLNREEEYKLPTESNDAMNNTQANKKHVSKAKQKITSTRVSNKTTSLDNEESTPPVNLPDISLPFMKAVPKFDIPLSKPEIAPIVTSNSQLNQNSNSANIFTQLSATSANSKTNSTEKFQSNIFSLGSAKSVLTSTEKTNGNTTVDSSIKNGKDLKYEFESPIKLNKNGDNYKPSNTVFKFDPPAQVGAVNKKQDNFVFKAESSATPIPKSSSSAVTSAPVVPQLKTGSVLDALKKPAPVATSSLSGQFKMPSSKWECSICNDDSRNECEACTTPRAKKQPEPTVASNPSTLAIKSTFGDAFKPKTDTWECPTCMIRNKGDCNECVACNTKNPAVASKVSSALPVPNAIPIASDTGFKNIVAQQSAKWECPACFTRNEDSRSKCVCCEQIKPGSTQVSSAEEVPKFSFGAASSKFTFGFGGSAQKEEDLKKIDTSNCDKKEAGENKGFLFGSSTSTANSTGGFTFGIKPVTTAAESGKDVTDTKPAFTFGVPKSVPTSETQSKVGIPSALSKEVSVKTDTTTTKPSPASTAESVFKPIGGMAFGKPAEPTKAEPTDVTLSSTENKSIFGVPSIAPSSSTASTGFSFGTSASKTDTTTDKPDTKSALANFVFGQSAPALSATPVFGVSGNPKAEDKKSETSTASTTSASIFGSFSASKPTVSTSSTPSLFGSPALVTSEATANAKPAPTFGSGFSAPQTQSSEKSVLGTDASSNLFTFGTSVNKSESKTSTIASPAFGTQATAASTSFTFGVSTTTQATAKLNAPASSSSTAPFSFGSAASAKPAEPTPPSKLFPSAPSSTSSGFGALASAGSTFGSASTPNTTLPSFGSFASPASSTSQPQTTFGQSANNAFGSANATPSFGAAASGSTPSGLFGSAASTATFGSSGFGSSGSGSFGSVPAATPTFGSGFSAPSSSASTDDGPAAKKVDTGFNFGGSNQQNAASSGGFNFSGSNNNNATKQAFNFTSTNNAPSFNFTGSATSTNTSQPFQFGAAAPTQLPVFNFGSVEATPNAPFQFNAANAANNMFAPNPMPGAAPASQPARRKMRTGTRRLTPR